MVSDIRAAIRELAPRMEHDELVAIAVAALVRAGLRAANGWPCVFLQRDTAGSGP